MEFDPDFKREFDGFPRAVQLKMASRPILLRERGPTLGRPHADVIHGSKVAHLKELIVQVHGEPWRVLFAFDAARRAILLVAGNKTGDDRWY